MDNVAYGKVILIDLYMNPAYIFISIWLEIGFLSNVKLIVK